MTSPMTDWIATPDAHLGEVASDEAGRRAGRRVREHLVPVKASGDKQTWETGAVRDSQDGKLRFDLIDPGFNSRLAEQMRKGAEHYGEYNWTKGIPSSRYMASLLRHIEAYRAGARDEDHLAAAAFNLMGIMRNEGTDLDDNFDWNASRPG